MQIRWSGFRRKHYASSRKFASVDLIQTIQLALMMRLNLADLADLAGLADCRGMHIPFPCVVEVIGGVTLR